MVKTTISELSPAQLPARCLAKSSNPPRPGSRRRPVVRPRAWRRGHQASSRRRAGNQRRPPCLGDPTDASVAGSSRSHSTPSWRGLDLHVDAGRYRSHRDSSQEGAVGEPPRRVRPPVTTNDWRVLLRRISVSEQTRLRAGLLGHAFRTSYIHIHCTEIPYQSH